MKCCINGGNVIRLLFLSAKLLKFEIQKCGQILCAHKPYFLMLGHIYYSTDISIVFANMITVISKRYSHCLASWLSIHTWIY